MLCSDISSEPDAGTRPCSNSHQTVSTAAVIILLQTTKSTCPRCLHPRSPAEWMFRVQGSLIFPTWPRNSCDTSDWGLTRPSHQRAAEPSVSCCEGLFWLCPRHFFFLSWRILIKVFHFVCYTFKALTVYVVLSCLYKIYSPNTGKSRLHYFCHTPFNKRALLLRVLSGPGGWLSE